MSTFDSLDETFDITPAEVVEKPVKAKPAPVTNKGEDREKDYQYSRAQLYNLVEKMQESLAHTGQSQLSWPWPLHESQ